MFLVRCFVSLLLCRKRLLVVSACKSFVLLLAWMLLWFTGYVE